MKLLVMALMVAVWSHPGLLSKLLGGWRDLDIDDKGALEAANVYESLTSGVTVKMITKAEKQAVAGVKYRLKLVVEKTVDGQREKMKEPLVGSEVPPDVVPALDGHGVAALDNIDLHEDHQESHPIISSVEPGVYAAAADLDTRYGTIGSETTTVPRVGFRKQVFGVDENKERGNWTGRLDFVLSMLGYAVGLGNIWRFPYLCYRNGGGAFLIPYLLFMTFVGIPLFFLESALGQFTSCGPTTCWDFAPLFKGVGVAMMISSSITSPYYCMIIAWCQYYFFASFTSNLPWIGCHNDWNTMYCSLNLPDVNCDAINGTSHANGTCEVEGAFKGVWNITVFQNITGKKRVTPSEEYWTNYVLDLSDGIEHLGAPKWDLVLSLLLAWILCFLCLLKGIKTTGRVVYFTATFPYVVLLILFIRGVMLEDAGLGITFYIKPDFHRLGDIKVWRDAAVQIFYSMGPAWGGLIALSSYNRFHNNVLRDSLIVSLGNCMTSIFGGFVIFSYIGHIAGQLKVPVGEVIQSGAGLAFVVYPEAVKNLPVPTLWSVIFFFMLITLGLDSAFATVEAIMTGILDLVPQYRKRKSYAIGIICAIFFLVGLPYTTRGGMYWLQLVDYYGAAWGTLLIGLTECLAINYVYGGRRFCSDIETMIGPWFKPFWVICWMSITPVGIVFILLFSWIDYTPVKYNDYVYPGWAEALGWIISWSAFSFIPILIIVQLLTAKPGMSIIQRFQSLIIPKRSWGPALIQHRQLIQHVPGFVVDPKDSRETEFGYVNMNHEHTSIPGVTVTETQT